MVVERIESNSFNAKKARLLESIGQFVENEAVLKCPVVTGNMRSRITHARVDENTVRVGTIGVPYAAYVEYGTAVMIEAHGPHDPEHPVTDWEALRKRGGTRQTLPFLRPAVFLAEPKIKELFRKEFK